VSRLWGVHTSGFHSRQSNSVDAATNFIAHTSLGYAEIGVTLWILLNLCFLHPTPVQYRCQSLACRGPKPVLEGGTQRAIHWEKPGHSPTRGQCFLWGFSCGGQAHCWQQHCPSPQPKRQIKQFRRLTFASLTIGCIYLHSTAMQPNNTKMYIFIFISSQTLLTPNCTTVNCWTQINTWSDQCTVIYTPPKPADIFSLSTCSVVHSGHRHHVVTTWWAMVIHFWN